jgi:hypothetical protein
VTLCGTMTAYNRGCRCWQCTEAAKLYHRERRARPPAPMEIREHGTARRYWAGCRCEECRKANAKYQADRRDLRSKTTE